MRIAELEAHHDALAAAESKIAAMVANREFPAVFAECEASFPHVAPAIQYRKKRGIEPHTPRLLSFTVVCDYAPPLFEHRVIESLLDFVRSARVLAKHEQRFAETVEAALQREELARMLWNNLESQRGLLHRDIRKTVGLDQEAAVAILKTWEELGVVIRKEEQNSYKLYLRSPLTAVAQGICPTCGVRGTGRMEAFLRPVSCEKCRTTGYYHITGAEYQ